MGSVLEPGHQNLWFESSSCSVGTIQIAALWLDSVVSLTLHLSLRSAHGRDDPAGPLQNPLRLQPGLLRGRRLHRTPQHPEHGVGLLRFCGPDPVQLVLLESRCMFMFSLLLLVVQTLVHSSEPDPQLPRFCLFRPVWARFCPSACPGVCRNCTVVWVCWCWIRAERKVLMGQLWFIYTLFNRKSWRDSNLSNRPEISVEKIEPVFILVYFVFLLLFIPGVSVISTLCIVVSTFQW